MAKGRSPQIIEVNVDIDVSQEGENTCEIRASAVVEHFVSRPFFDEPVGVENTISSAGMRGLPLEGPGSRRLLHAAINEELDVLSSLLSQFGFTKLQRKKAMDDVAVDKDSAMYTEIRDQGDHSAG